MLITLAKVYRAPLTVKAIKDSKGRRNCQCHMLVLCKVQLAKQCKTTAIKAKKEVIDMYDIPSSQGTTPSLREYEYNRFLFAPPKSRNYFNKQYFMQIHC
jgi:hypothetical protein